ncbi:MAG: hypothetical protein JRG80_04485 [Deltaproteobacteria bacterium]|nr:hypothetical protein [Deltaproteobacteria bacterium]
MSSSIAPSGSSEKLIGAHSRERVSKPDSSSTETLKFGSLLTSRTVWQTFSRMLRPMMPVSIPSRMPVIGFGPTEAMHSRWLPLSSISHSDPASA